MGYCEISSEWSRCERESEYKQAESIAAHRAVQSTTSIIGDSTKVQSYKGSEMQLNSSKEKRRVR